MDLYHYFDRRTGPFKSLTKLSPEKAKEVLEAVKAERPASFCAQRNEEYVEKRRRRSAFRSTSPFFAAAPLSAVILPFFAVAPLFFPFSAVAPLFMLSLSLPLRLTRLPPR